VRRDLKLLEMKVGTALSHSVETRINAPWFVDTRMFKKQNDL
jgi:hypothetical protein